ncbi:hypothetical protein KAFR_0A06370 [Kazachstania africana CBS 2517]|uniref:1,3-beta-glucanosyltransferase n=1 Tax=Kazachstania africana (strain ATCC 22294 / BCRC 22015 / CBS 2517 / CECT 1963 / NBRC 1671 / NRRL Y-8276) TaxID=1071382 RepID=H2ANX2_KAZAF|nr:hypothetical protein KAFR_0A06370 [Kazachstania africana CBS 2517]CCF56072.1 hypothetical protein KAFR_0A06370 [Kazachstania africana CBS 2517]
MNISRAILGNFLLFTSIVSLAKASVSDATCPEIEIYGGKFFNSKTGEQFFMKGIAYQPQRTLEDLEEGAGIFETKYVDPLADTSLCLRDIPYLRKLDVNTIRVYSVDPTKNHDVCMEELKKAGIYVILDLSEPDLSITRDHPEWDVDLLNRYKSVVDAMHSYSNVLGFFAGNEVTNDDTNTDASPFVKAAIRDTKKHIREQGYRAIPVGYSTNDDAETRAALAQYFICGDVTADFYGINMYEWCGYSSYGTSGYKERTEEFEGYPIPIFFSEFGCNAIRPRPFTEVSALFSEEMSSTWSGGLVYMYFEEDNGYGVVKAEGENVYELDDFDTLQKQYSKARPKGTTKEEYAKNWQKSNDIVSSCPPKTEVWKATDRLPATPDLLKCSCLEEVLPCIMTAHEDNEKYVELFSYICSQVDCSDIAADGVTGIYGEYSDCSITQKLSLQYSKLYTLRSSKNGVCPNSDANKLYFNPRSLHKFDKYDKCNARAKKVEELLSKSSRTGSGEGDTSDSIHKRTNKPKDGKSQKSGSTQQRGSGYVILFVSVFIASILL